MVIASTVALSNVQSLHLSFLARHQNNKVVRFIFAAYHVLLNFFLRFLMHHFLLLVNKTPRYILEILFITWFFCVFKGIR